MTAADGQAYAKAARRSAFAVRDFGHQLKAVGWTPKQRLALDTLRLVRDSGGAVHTHGGPTLWDEGVINGRVASILEDKGLVKIERDSETGVRWVTLTDVGSVWELP